MHKIIDDLPETVVLKNQSINVPEERMAFEVVEAILRVLHEFVQQRPLDFFHLAGLCKKGFDRAAEKAVRKYFPDVTDAVPAILAVFRAALISDGIATRLGSPYDIEASYQNTGLLYDQRLYQIVHRTADCVYQTSVDFGNSERCVWMYDRRDDSPYPKDERAQGLFLNVYCQEFPNKLITPWGTWRFVESTESTRSSYLYKDKVSLLEVATADLVLEPVSIQRNNTIYAIKSAFGDALPRAKILPDLKEAGESQYRYISAVWKHGAKWLDPACYF